MCVVSSSRGGLVEVTSKRVVGVDCGVVYICVSGTLLVVLSTWPDDSIVTKSSSSTFPSPDSSSLVAAIVLLSILKSRLLDWVTSELLIVLSCCGIVSIVTDGVVVETLVSSIKVETVDETALLLDLSSDDVVTT